MSGTSGGSGISQGDVPPRVDEVEMQTRDPGAFANAVAGLQGGPQPVAGGVMGAGASIGIEVGPQTESAFGQQPFSTPEMDVAEAGTGLQPVQNRAAVTPLADRASGAAEAPGAQTQAGQSGAGPPLAGASGVQAATQPAAPMPVAAALDAAPPGVNTLPVPNGAGTPPDAVGLMAMMQAGALGLVQPASPQPSAPTRKPRLRSGVSSSRAATSAGLSDRLPLARNPGQPLQMAYGLWDQAGGLLADEQGDTPSPGSRSAARNANRGMPYPWTDRGNPLLAWALGGVLGASMCAPLWDRMGLSLLALIARLQERPWEVLSWHLRRTVWAAEFLAVAGLPGPFGTLLRAGIEPRAALTLQLGWEAALLGGSDPFSGRVLPVLWQTWALGSSDNLAMLVRALLGDAAPVLPADAARTSEQAQRVLGIRPAAPPLMTLDPAILLLGTGGWGILSGTGLAGLRRINANEDAPAASGLAAVRPPSGPPLLLAQQAAGGLPGIAGRSGSLVLGDGLELATGTAGQLLYVAATLVGTRSLPQAGLIKVLLGILAAAPIPLHEPELHLPLEGAGMGVVTARVGDG